MTVSERRCNGSALVGIVLLLVALVLAGAAWYFLSDSGNKGPSSNSTTATAPKAAVEPAKNEPEKPARKAAEGPNAHGPKKAAKPISFDVVCLGPEGADHPLVDLDVDAAPASAANGSDREHAVVVKTDAHGVAHFADLPYVMYEVNAAPKGYIPLRLRPARDGKRLEMLFSKGAPFSGKVTNSSSNAPIVKAYVQVRCDFGIGPVLARIHAAQRQGVDVNEIQDHEKLTDPTPYFRTDTETDAEGSFSIAAIPDGQKVVVSIEHDDYDLFEDVVDVKDSSPITRNYSLLPRTEIFGKVVADDSGEPIIGAKVEAGERGMPINAIRMFGANSADIYEATTDANGVYRLKRIPRGKQYLSVKYQGYEDYVATFEVRSAEPFEHQIRLKRAASLQGQIVDNASNPIEGVDIFWVMVESTLLGQKALPTEAKAKTAADGTFTLRGLPVGRPFNVLARHPDFVHAEQDHIVLQPGEEMTGMQIMMSHGGAISGMVVDSMRQPIADATITARPTKPTGPALTPVRSGADGAFIINNTQPATFELSCEAPAYVKSMHANVRDVATGVQFVLVKEATYAGRFIGDISSEPIQKYRIRVRPADATNTHEVRVESIRDKDGKFQIKGLAPGLWDFEFSSDNVAPTILSHVAVREGEKIENQDVRARSGSSAFGVVKSLTGKPVQQALVRMDFLESFSSSDKTYTTLQGSTNTNGEYEIKNLLPGRYKMWVTHPMFAPSGEREVVIEESPKTQIDWKLPKPASLRVVVRDDQGNTIPGAKVSLFKGDSPLDSAEKVVGGGMVGLKVPQTSPERTGIGSASDPSANSKGMQVTVGETGEITFSRKEPGKWTLWVTAKDFYKSSARLDLEAGKESVHEATLYKIEPGKTAKEFAQEQGLTDQIIRHTKRKAEDDPSAKGADSRTSGAEKLTPEQRIVLKKKRDGEELTPEETKMYREIRKIMNDKGDNAGKGDAGMGAGRKGKGKGKKGDKSGDASGDAPAGGGN